MYSGDIIRILTDCILAWLNYINFMTLNKIMIIVEIFIYFITILAQIGHFQLMIMERSNGTLLIFLIQYFLVYFLAIIIISKTLFDHQIQQINYKKMKLVKSIKGRLELEAFDKTVKVVRGKYYQSKILTVANFLLKNPSDDDEEGDSEF
jgi:ABC-type multidrug transport system fused ATPase/permease subunit